MAERTSGARRITMQNLAEREIQRYADDHALWHKHVHNAELDPAQILKMIEMDQNRNTIDFSCRRTGKTAVKELYLLEDNAKEADQELGIVAPREAQSLVNLNTYHLEPIRRSPILKAYLAHKNGRIQMADKYYQFANRSVARAYGVMAQVDGADLTAASLEEVDDMPRDRLFNRFLLTMGSRRRMGASQDSLNEPQIRITGVFKGADTLTDLVASGSYKILPVIDMYLGLEMGILQQRHMEEMREQLAPDEYIRQLLCRNVSARNLIWESYIRRALQTGLKAGLDLVAPIPGAQYKKRGLVACGYDHSGHGEDPQASRYAFVAVEQIGNFCCFIFARQWPPGTDEITVKNDIKGLWRYFRPDYAMGDAYGIGMLTQLNDELFQEGLTPVDRRTIGDGQSTASTWPEWAFSPVRFEGMTKHQMATALRAIFHNRNAAIPYVEDFNLTDPETADLRALIRQLPNIRTEQTKAAYASYRMVNPKLGDDLFDAAMAAVWALATRGAAPVESRIITRTTSREQLLGGARAMQLYLWLAAIHQRGRTSCRSSRHC